MVASYNTCKKWIFFCHLNVIETLVVKGINILQVNLLQVIRQAFSFPLLPVLNFITSKLLVYHLGFNQTEFCDILKNAAQGYIPRPKEPGRCLLS